MSKYRGLAALFAGTLGLVTLASSGVARAAELFSPKIMAVLQYFKTDYPEAFGDTHYHVRLKSAILGDVDDDGVEEAILLVQPHFRQSPTILLFRVSADMTVTRVIEGLAPGPLVPISGDYLNAHELGEAIDAVVRYPGDDRDNAPRKAAVRAGLQKKLAVVEYANFLHTDARKGKGMYLDMTHLKQPAPGENCQGFEFSTVDRIEVVAKPDGSGNHLLAWVGGDVYDYKIRKIRDDGMLEKTMSVVGKE